MPSADTVTYRINAGAAQTYAWPLPHDPSLTERRVVDMTEAAGDRPVTDATWRASGLNVIDARVLGALVYLVISGGADGTPGRVELTVHTPDGDIPVVVTQAVTAILTLGGGQTVPSSISTTTTDTTPTTLMQVPVAGPNGASLALGGRVLARNTVGNDTVRFDLSAIVTGYGTSQIAVETQAAPPLGGSTAMQGCTVAVSVADGTVKIIGTGLAGVTIAWGGSVTCDVA